MNLNPNLALFNKSQLTKYLLDDFSPSISIEESIKDDIKNLLQVAIEIYFYTKENNFNTSKQLLEHFFELLSLEKIVHFFENYKKNSTLLDDKLIINEELIYNYLTSLESFDISQPFNKEKRTFKQRYIEFVI